MLIRTAPVNPAPKKDEKQSIDESLRIPKTVLKHEMKVLELLETCANQYGWNEVSKLTK